MNDTDEIANHAVQHLVYKLFPVQSGCSDYLFYKIPVHLLSLLFGIKKIETFGNKRVAFPIYLLSFVNVFTLGFCLMKHRRSFFGIRPFSTIQCLYQQISRSGLEYLLRISCKTSRKTRGRENDFLYTKNLLILLAEKRL